MSEDQALALLLEARDYLREIKALALGGRMQDLLARIDTALGDSLPPERAKEIREFAVDIYGDG